MVKGHFGYIAALFLLTSTSIATKSHAVEPKIYWIDTFETDSLTNWKITHGNWTVENGSLVVAEVVPIPPLNIPYGSIWRQQAQMTGTLSFDVLPTSNETFGFLFYFIGNGLGGSVDNHPYAGYALHLWDDHKVDLDYVDFGGYQGTLKGYFPPERPYVGWIHFDVTRDHNGEMIIFVNSTEVLRATHNQVSFSENLSISAELGVKFDNIEFNSTIKTTPLPNSTSSLVSSTETSSTPNRGSFPPFLTTILFLTITVIIIHRKRKFNRPGC
jgi:hypothetical protein